MSTVRPVPRMHSFICPRVWNYCLALWKRQVIRPSTLGRPITILSGNRTRLTQILNSKDKLTVGTSSNKTSLFSFSFKPRVEKSTPRNWLRTGVPTLPRLLCQPITLRMTCTAKSLPSTVTPCASMTITSAKFWPASRGPDSRRTPLWFIYPTMEPITWFGINRCQRKVAFMFPSCLGGQRNGCPIRVPVRTWSVPWIWLQPH